MSFTIESRILSRVHYPKYSTIDYAFEQPNETKSYIRWQGEALNAIYKVISKSYKGDNLKPGCSILIKITK